MNLIYAFFLQLWIKVLSFFQNKPVKRIEPTIVEQNHSFVDKNKNHFLKSIENLDNTKNSQIDPFFYNKKEYLAVMDEPNNQCEKTWKRRILMCATPQGTNIIMYYDPYKLGFTYYCDQNISYNILNSIAMKYVLLYKCYDFFLDECITNEPSPILKLLEDNKPESSIVRELDSNLSKNDREFKEMLKTAPVAKFKNYNKKTETSSQKKVDEKKKQIEAEKPKERNRFINLGKVTNFSFLQKTIKKPAVRFSDSSLLKTGLFSNADVQKEVFHYRDFKRLKTDSVSKLT